MSTSIGSLLLDFKNNTLEENLNSLVAILRKHLAMDVAFISEFVDGERVFRFVDATSGGIRPGNSDPLESTYCSKVASGELEPIVPDTRLNPITGALPITDKLGIGAYMGVPITLGNGELYGTFCCFKRFADESLNQRDAAFLQVISEIAAGLIANHIEEDASRAETIAHLEGVLEQGLLEIHFQPIYSLECHRTVAYEALSRFKTEPYMPPDVWFAHADKVDMGEHLELAAITEALKYSDYLAPSCITVNASPKHIASGAVGRVLEGADLSRVVLEVTEHAPIDDYAALKAALEPLRKQGLRLAIDDAGAGYASFQHILELEADIIKLDISLTRDIHLKPKKYLLAKSLSAYAKAINCTVVAEGVECEQEFAVLCELNVDKVQGYYIGRPAPVHEAVKLEPAPSVAEALQPSHH